MSTKGTQNNPIQLDAVDVYPQPWQLDIKRNFGDNEILKEIYKTLSSYQHIPTYNPDFLDENSTYGYDAAKRFYKTWAYAGKPKVHREMDSLTSLLPKSLLLSNMKIRAYNKFGSIWNVGNKPLHNTIAEMAHPIQDKVGKESYLKGVWDNIIGQRLNPEEIYNKPGHVEYETHEVIEPKLKDYIVKNIPTEYVPDMYYKYSNF